MNTVQLTDTQVKKLITALNFKANKKRQEIRNIQRRKETIIEQVGEEEVNHRVYTRQRWVTKADDLITHLKAFVEVETVSKNVLATA